MLKYILEYAPLCYYMILRKVWMSEMELRNQAEQIIECLEIKSKTFVLCPVQVMLATKITLYFDELTSWLRYLQKHDISTNSGSTKYLT